MIIYLWLRKVADTPFHNQGGDLPPPLATAEEDMRPAPILPAEIPAPVKPKPQTTPAAATGAKTAPAATPPTAAPPTASADSTPLVNRERKITYLLT